jgi:hypothetical protein
MGETFPVTDFSQVQLVDIFVGFFLILKSAY